jgi:hypothetical protein
MIKFALPLTLLFSCSNSYYDYYKGDKFPATPSASHVTSAPTNSDLIGQSNFVSSNDPGNPVKAAKKIGADYVVTKSEYLSSSTSTGIMPLTTPTTDTSYVSGSVSDYSGNYGTYSGTVTTYGSKTTYMPYSVTSHLYRYGARFYKKNVSSSPLEWSKTNALLGISYSGDGLGLGSYSWDSANNGLFYNFRFMVEELPNNGSYSFNSDKESFAFSVGLTTLLDKKIGVFYGVGLGTTSSYDEGDESGLNIALGASYSINDDYNILVSHDTFIKCTSFGIMFDF